MADQWPNGVLLVEETFDDATRIPFVILAVFSKMFDAGPCLSALCMYDGAFGNYEGIFSESVADQTYAFCFAKHQHVISLDSDILSSREWSSVIALCRERLV